MSHEAHYGCGRCHLTFPQSEARIRRWDEPSEAWGQVAFTTNELHVCPHCGSEDIDQVALCKACGKVEQVEGIDFCEPCYQADEAKQDAIVAAFNERVRRIRLLATARKVLADLKEAG